jgi:diguanylate cyclase (GGDEF)-like protein/PAS domain S-box-containing protein
VADLCGADLLISDAESGTLLDCNRSAPQRLGYSREQLLSLRPEQIVADPSLDANSLAEQRRQLVSRGGGHGSSRYRCRNGTVLDVESHHRVVRWRGQRLVVTVALDRTAQRSRELELDARLQLFSSGEAIAGVGFWSHDLSSGAMLWSDEMHRICETDPERLQPTFRTYTALVHPEDRTVWNRHYHMALDRGEPCELRHRLLFQQGRTRTVQLRCEPDYDDKGHPVCVRGTIEDISRRERQQQEIERARLQDGLTGLPNKTATMEWLSQQLVGRPYNANLAVISLDLDGFQEVNDSFGTEVGDQLLQGIAERLRGELAEHVWVARIGSDEFVVIRSQGVTSFGDAINSARELQQHLHRFGKLKANLPLTPTVCVGISSYPEHGEDSRQLLQSANTALMEAKRQGRGQLRAYSTTISRQIRERLELDHALNSAIDRDQLRIVLQPQSNRAGELSGAEVLLRWTHHQGTQIPPSYFIPLAEQSGLIFPISHWVLCNTLATIRQWRELKQVIPRLAINISTRLLESPDRHLALELHEALAEHGLGSEVLELEITETALLQNPVHAAQQLRHLASEGFKIAIDDFGTGYSSMELLRTLPVHKLKIDRSFVKNVPNSAEDQAIVQATITLAHGLGMRCLAEGVETTAQREVLLGLGCDEFQGYLCGRAMAVDRFRELLQQPLIGCTELPSSTPLVTLLQASLHAPSIPLPQRTSAFDELEALRRSIDDSLDAYFVLQAVYSPTGEVIDFTLLEANRTACSYLQQERERIVGQPLCTLYPGVINTGLLQHYANSVLSGNVLEIDDFAYTNHEVYGDTRVFDLRAYPRGHMLTATWRDVTSRSHRYRHLANAAALYQLVTENIAETIVLADLQGSIVWVSSSLTTLTGWQRREWLGRPFSELFASGQGEPTPLQLEDWLQQPGQVDNRRLRLVDPGGGWNWVDVNGRRLSGADLRRGDRLGLSEDNGPASGRMLQLEEGFVLTVRSANEAQIEARRLERMARQDSLTGLLNRNSLLETLTRQIGSGRDQRQSLALLYCDFDHFKQINDRYGHACGDDVLRQVAQRLQSQVRSHDLTARLGGDEFLVVLRQIDRLEDAMAVARKLVAAVARPMQVKDTELVVSISVGVAMHAQGEDTDLLLGRADRAMYAAKQAGRNQVLAG